MHAGPSSSAPTPAGTCSNVPWPTTGKVLRGVPPGFATSTFGDATRQPVLIVAHLADLMAWAVTLAHALLTAAREQRAVELVSA